MGYTVFWAKNPQQINGEDSYYHLFSQRVDDAEIMCLGGKSVGIGDTQIVVGTRSSKIQMWKLSTNDVLSLFSVRMPTTIPSTVVFVDNSESVQVFGREDGSV